MSKYIRERFNNYEAYTPGEQLNDKKYIKLNTNESPFPPGPKVLDAISAADLEKLRLYPSPNQQELKEAIKEQFKDVELMSDNVFVSNGSDDIINFAFMAYTGESIPVAFPDISYGFYKVFADFKNVKTIEIPLNDDFELISDDYCFKDDNAPGLIVFANPNAPTGIALKINEVEKIVKNNKQSVVLVDEAYIDFGGETAIPLVEKYDNVLVSRTYSKSASLAGARLGYAIGSKELISDLELMKYSTNPYNVNRMTELVGLAVLDEIEYYQENCKKIIDVRERTADKLKEMGFFVSESKANFLFVGSGVWAKQDSLWSKIKAEEIYKQLKDNGILVRWFGKKRIEDFLRISIGTEEDMDNMIGILERKGEEWLRKS